ncbi:Spc97/Spc98 family protein [Xylariales sp. AK1849]|nr:Spc97/Spc98 family protein [Xylariales sp. AK1849]
MADEDDADVFAIPDFWKTSRWLDLSRQDQSEFFDLSFRTDSRTPWIDKHTAPPVVKSEEFFKLPAALEPLAINGKSRVYNDTSGLEDLPKKTGTGDVDFFSDTWLRDEELPKPSAEFKSWDGFVMPDIPPVEPLFLTEAGPLAYDAALQSPDDSLRINNYGHNVVQTNPYISALLALALGRASIFFTWDEKSTSFAQNLDKLRISGYSTDVLQSLQQRCLQCGNISRFLNMFVQVTYRTHPSAGRIALAKAIDSLLLVIQRELGSRTRQIGSLLQLQSLVQPVHCILAYVSLLVTKINKARTDEHLLSVLFEETQALEHGDELLSEVMREVLTRVTEPWTDFAQKWIGVRIEAGNPITKDGTGKSFVKVENVAYMDDFGLEVSEPDYVLDERRIPSFVSEDIARTMFETGRNLRLLRTHHPENPLCNLNLVQSKKPPSLEWHYDWKSIEQLQQEVDEYEASLLKAVRHQGSNRGGNLFHDQTNTNSGYSLQLFGREENQLAEQLLLSIKQLSQPLPALSEADKLSQLVHSRLFEDELRTQQKRLDLTPHWSLVPVLSFGPLVEAQARLVNREYMRLLFSSHKLRDHIVLQRDFQLLGNGLFCSRLSHALFDTELETAERQAGVARKGGVMGLRLGGRESWPPASSELRLALMGVLTESYCPPTMAQSSMKEVHDLPGDLSFAVRDLSDEEIDKCLDPGSLEALDFLRLSYKPPAPLAPIITPVILVKYDRIFKLLLRVLRMLYVTGEMYRDTNVRTSRWGEIDIASLRFRFEAQHFVASITTYFLDTGIGLPWSRFEDWLAMVQSGLEDDNAAHQKARLLSPNGLREYHEQVLDHIMQTIFLRKRQQPVLKLLEDIFALILKFSKFARLKATGQLEKVEGSSSQELYSAFKKKVNIFITVCRALNEKGGQSSRQTRNDFMTYDGKASGAEEENTIDRFLVQLDMSAHYRASEI